ncbi:MAG: AAA family ATPase [Rhodospirillales bacterium RIFCSPLOWO2_12_FULL_58_28]|nr:MAG: AAA family ATPase [Rhodospirillales bacterium RIFCSPLOWO2_02_FULL_58_16]OHC78434.1 MAG: AAA family ATPase [Rhodospirillales bacterium RIFCSPLOWO2_12_FULL_58_28]
MLTRIKIRNFKRFDNVDVELGKAVVLIGPNNSGKTTALQAIALWDIGIRRWNEKRKGKSLKERPGVTVNRRDLVSIPVPVANLLWHDLHTRDVRQSKEDGKLRQKTENVRVDIIIDGVTHDKAWSCGFEFDYANEESFYCRPLRINNGSERMPVPDEAGSVRVAFLPPMSGLADREFVKEPGEIGVLIGQGQTAQVLRNLCYQIYKNDNSAHWDALVKHIRALFGVELLTPQYIAERSEITMAYKDERKNKLDLSSSGRGMQQTLLLLAHLYANPKAVLLLDEPDAHLEILRQRQIYNLLIEVAGQQGSQIIAASHSEIILNEAAGRDAVVAFVGKPHRIDDRGSQVLKALRDIGFDQYYQAEETGWVLYVENSTDLAILQAFAKLIDHPAQQYLERPFVKYVETNLPGRAREHFFGLQEAKKNLVGIAVFDRLNGELQSANGLTEMMWRRREIENYFCMEEVLLAYAGYDLHDDLFGKYESSRREQAMKAAVAEVTDALRTLGKPDPWSLDVKATDEFLDPLFKKYFQKLKLPLQLRKSDYHTLAGLVPRERLDEEIKEKLDAIVATAKQAQVQGD